MFPMNDVITIQPVLVYEQRNFMSLLGIEPVSPNLLVQTSLVL